MNATYTLDFAIASLILLAIPGPTILIVVVHVIVNDRRHLGSILLGIVTGDLFTMSLSLAGVGALMITHQSLYLVFKIAGAIYLVFVGVRLWIGRRNSIETTDTEIGITSKASFGQAFLVTALNPKSIMFFLAFVPQFIDERIGFQSQAILYVLMFAVISVLVAYTYANLILRIRDQIDIPRLNECAAVLGSVVLVGFGSWALISGLMKGAI